MKYGIVHQFTESGCSIAWVYEYTDPCGPTAWIREHSIWLFAGGVRTSKRYVMLHNVSAEILYSFFDGVVLVWRQIMASKRNGGKMQMKRDKRKKRRT